jgi:hypothetical protein
MKPRKAFAIHNPRPMSSRGYLRRRGVLTRCEHVPQATCVAKGNNATLSVIFACAAKRHRSPAGMVVATGRVHAQNPDPPGTIAGDCAERENHYGARMVTCFLTDGDSRGV